MSGLGGGAPKPPGRRAVQHSRSDAASAPATPEPKREPAPLAHRPAGVAVDRQALDRMLDGRRNRKDEAVAELLGVQIGDEAVDADTLRSMGGIMVAEHLMLLLAKKRAHLERVEALAEVADLLIAIDDGPKVKRVLGEMPTAGRIVDIYPLEVMVYVLERRPDLLDGVAMAPFLKNRDEVEGTTHPVEAEIRLRLPVNLKVRAFALDGGGSPGYCFAPGGPGEYILEVGDSGRFGVLVMAERRRESLIDRFEVTVADQGAVTK